MWLKGIGSVLMVVLVSACAPIPVIESGKFSPPKVVVIDDIPDIVPAAKIGVFAAGGRRPQFYFTPDIDSFYALNAKERKADQAETYGERTNQMVMSQIANSPRPVSAGTGAAMGLAGGLVGGLIDAAAEETQRKAAEFPALARRAMHNADLRDDLLRDLRESLEAKGIKVVIASNTREVAPRLHWPAKNARGEPLLTGPLSDSAPVEADLLIQVSATAAYTAIGEFYHFTPHVGLAVAIFDGRTREFVGWQAFRFSPRDDKFDYLTYSGLVADVDKAAPELRTALLSLVPDVVRVVSGTPR
jgi:hypothetical protein